MKAIMYHYVRPYNPSYHNLKHLDINDFKLQLDYFENEFGFLSKNEFAESLQTGRKASGIILTFDDALSCHYDHVLPELIRRGLWGIFYIPTKYYVKASLLDVHKIHILLGKYESKEIYNKLRTLTNESQFDSNHIDEFRKLTYQTQDNDNYTLLVKRTLNYFIDYKYKALVLDGLMDYFLDDRAKEEEQFYLNKDQLLEMEEQGMMIGSHTETHPVLSRLSKKEQFREINNSFLYLERIGLRMPTKTFCYPYGGFHSFNSDTEDILNQIGVDFSFNVEQRDINSSDLAERKQALPRYDCDQFEHGQVRERFPSIGLR